MKKIVLLALLSLSFGSAVQAAEAQVTEDALKSKGWTCVAVGDKSACTPPGDPSLLEVNKMRKRPATLLVMIFDAVKPAFIGSENLIRADQYFGEACPRAGKLEPYKFEMLGAGYFSCHHFEKEIEL